MLSMNAQKIGLVSLSQILGLQSSSIKYGKICNMNIKVLVFNELMYFFYKFVIGLTLYKTRAREKLTTNKSD